MDLSRVFRQILGSKFVDLLEFLYQVSDKRGFITLTIDEISAKTNISKPTIIKYFKILEEKKVLKRIKNGVYKLSR